MAHAPGRLGLAPGNSGRPIQVTTNSFAVKTLPSQKFVHYDGFPDLKIMPKRDRALEIIDKLQIQEAALFSPRAAYDGQHNLFRSVPLDLPNGGGIFKVYMRDIPPGTQPSANDRGLNVRITQVAIIDPKALEVVINGRGSHNSESLTTLTLLNILIRMKPIMSNPSNRNSFFTQDKREILGGGLELWRGLFQSVRPTFRRLLVNIDIATAVMYSGGPLIDLVLQFLNLRDARDLVPSQISPVDQRRLSQFLKNLRVAPLVPVRPPPLRYNRRIRGIVMTGADQYTFTNDDTGEQLTITEHFMKAHRYVMKLGKIFCIDFGRGIVYPMEALKVKEGQIYKKTLPSALAPKALKFATQKPQERAQAIQRGAQLLGYADSEYLHHSGMAIQERLISIKGRVMPPPSIQWGGKQHPEVPNSGAWNVLGKQFYSPGVVMAWAVVVYDTRTNPDQVWNFIRSFIQACRALEFPEDPPEILPGRARADAAGHHEDMEKAGFAAIKKFENEFPRDMDPNRRRPTFILVVLPDSAIDIRTSIKYWGDCIRGCPTQCIKAGKLARANNQYCNNLALKVNTKIGGVNSIPAGNVEAVRWLAKAPTMIIGADVSHAGPDTDRPSVSALVSSVDSEFCRYVASAKVQQAREEIIADLDVMVENAVQQFYLYWKARGVSVAPKRIIFFRDGVSEGQFGEVGVREVQKVKETLVALWKKIPVLAQTGPPPKITFIIVAKNHHVRFFPENPRDADRSGNCPAGMVIDEEIVNPVMYDFYLQSHRGLLGTSRPSHYTVIEDGNNIGANMLQAISYTLCHVYARATCSVSIPAPVYYADIVCARGRFHSRLIHDGSDFAASTASEEISLDDHRKAFKGLADNMKNTMYFM